MTDFLATARKEANSDRFLEELREDVASIRDALKDKIRAEIVHRLRKDARSAQEFLLWNLHETESLEAVARKTPLKVRTFFTGFWNTEQKCHDGRLWAEAGVDFMLTELNKVVAPVTLEDVSDRTISSNFVIKVCVPACGE